MHQRIDLNANQVNNQVVLESTQLSETSLVTPVEKIKTKTCVFA